MSAPFGASERELTRIGRGAVDRRMIPIRILFLLVIGFLIWLPRGLDLDRVVTPDEPLWLARSANFAKGLSDANFDQTYQYAHPGVTVMWAGSLGYLFSASEYLDNGPDTVRQSGNLIAGELTALGLSPLETLDATRESLVIFIVIVLTLSAWYAIRLFGLGPGLIGAAFLASDPFHIALSRLLHLDGLLSALVGLAALVWLNYLFRGRRRTDLIVAGIVVGLAGLTRTLAIVLLPMIVLSAIVEAPGGMATVSALWRVAWRRLAPVLVVGVVALLTFVALWPAMWTSPIKTTEDFINVGLELGQKAHERPIFFNGAIYDGVDPGHWFYPESFMWRTTPTLLVGLVLSALAIAAKTRVRDRSVTFRSALYLLVLAATILVTLDMSEKKLDRYIIPIVPPLAFVAGWGVGETGKLISRFAAKRNSRLQEEMLLGLASVLLVAVNVISVVRVHPYGLSYFNPLLGGAPAARSVIMVGWGEGLDQIAGAMAQQPDSNEQRFITSSWKTPISYFLDDRDIGTFDFHASDALENWLRSDFYVWYITPALRGYIPPEMQAYFDQLTPTSTVNLNGLRYAALYDVRNASLPPFFLQQAWMATIAPGVELVLASISPDVALPGGTVTAVFYVTGGDPNANYRVQLTLVAPDGSQIVGKSQTLPVTVGDSIWSVRRRIALPPEATLGTYWVTARFTADGASTDVVLGSVTVANELVPTPEPIEDELEEGDIEG